MNIDDNDTETEASLSPTAKLAKLKDVCQTIQDQVKDVEELKKQVWPDFHHARDLEAAGRIVSFLSDEITEAFALYGPPAMIAEQLTAVLKLDHQIDMVIPHPVPSHVPKGADPAYIERFATEVIPAVRSALAD